MFCVLSVQNIEQMLIGNFGITKTLISFHIIKCSSFSVKTFKEIDFYLIILCINSVYWNLLRLL